MKRTYKYMTLTALAAVISFSATAAMAQTSRDLMNRLSRMENEIQTLSRAVYRGEQPPAAAMQGGAMDAQSGAAFEVRLQGLEQQIRDLTGQVERQSYEMRQMQDMFDRFKTDASMRLDDIEKARSGGVAQPQGNIQGQPGGMQYIPSQNRNVQIGAASGAPAPLTIGDVQAPAVQTNLGSIPANRGVQNVNGAASAYESAFALLRGGQYDQAETAFDAFLKNNPDHPLAGNAQYWLAETYYVRGNFERAARLFATAYQKYPQGQKAPDNLLKLGLSLGSMGNSEDACVALQQLQKEFGGQASPVTRRGEQEMSRLGC